MINSFSGRVVHVSSAPQLLPRSWVAGVQCDPDADDSKPKFQQMPKEQHTLKP
jgi:hypothetical protein